jgi:large subunit ribosomal protein L4
MSGKVLSVESCKALGFNLVEGSLYNHALHEVVVAYRAARRSGTACVKSKADVNLSGAKPWRQKGTGRARAGYKSSPVWVGGGVVFGPHPRSYRKVTSRGLRSVALRKALSLRVKDGAILTTSTFEVESAKTRDFVSLAVDILGGCSGAIVGKGFSPRTFLSARNVKGVQLLRAEDITAEDVLRFKKIAFTDDALGVILGRINVKPTP